ncbi:MAG: hypothetical protein Q8P05_01685 [Candidatus Diapherotrites archaeon]|nr:hypothetical protein [Candidatus Diapherotrites archaeon]MDZ4256367.1 hypothetical protein [archaeon]
MPPMRPILRDIYHVGVALVLVLVILGLITWSGFLSCRDIPGWCDVYYGIKGSPKTLIVFGDDGLGNPDWLAQQLRDPNGAHASNLSRQQLDFVSAGNLKEFDLVIVTRARTMPTEKLKAFMEYADAGGRLIWTGDAGTGLTNEDQFLYADDLDENAGHEILTPWARKDSETNTPIRFDQYISAAYQGNWCEVRECAIEQQVGLLVPETGADHPLIFGIANNLNLYGDFSLVRELGIGSTIVLSVDTQTLVRDTGGKELGRVFPLIITSGVGEKIVYYAVPPEYYGAPPMTYKLLLENLYVGMLR